MLDLSSARTGSLPAAIATSNVTVTPAAPASRFVLRGVDAIAAAGAAFGVAIPTRPLASETSGDRAALWLGPDEWLLLAPEAETATIYQQVSGALDGIACALVDVSHRQTALLVEGSKAASVLNAGVPLDLSLKAFPVGMVARTIFEKAEIVLWRTGPEAFRVEVWRSFAPYVLALLQAADRDAA
jgi:sarcosine oxidase subunit gamma